MSPTKSASQAGSNRENVGRSEEQRLSTELLEPARPFRLVKYFSYTGFIVILIFILGLTIFISSQAKDLVLKKNQDYALLLANNLNHQVFQQFVVPVAIRFGYIRLREPRQFELLDAVVKSTIHGFNVKRVVIYDLENTIAYSTDLTLVGTKSVSLPEYEQALQGKNSSLLDTTPGQEFTAFDQVYTLRTFFPFRAEKPVLGAVGAVLGVFEIYQDLTDEYAEISKFQFLSVALSLGFSALLFFILRQILARGENILEIRNEERLRLEEKLHQSQRLASLGQMIAAVAHEVRNPLGIISSTAELLQNKIKAHEPNNMLADVIVEEARRLNGIVTEFLDFARPQVPRPVKCSLSEVLEKNLTFLAPALEKDKIEVIRDYQGPEYIEADPDLLYRAFLNVFINAIQAMPDGGRLRVGVGLLLGPDGKNQGLAEVVISDTGEGIDQAQAENLFTPFFTTKNRGSGLGLAIVKNIVDGHKGTVTIEPGAEGGTRLIFHLPLRQQ
ncbi:MAG: ATP-binding protein [Thermodesulfobacteriota bacterium]